MPRSPMNERALVPLRGVAVEVAFLACCFSPGSVDLEGWIAASVLASEEEVDEEEGSYR